MRKVILKSTLAVVAVAASCLGAWNTYVNTTCLQIDNNLLLVENLSAIAESNEKDPVYCKTKEFISSDGSNGGIFGGPLGLPKCFICSNGYAEYSEDGKKTCKRLQSPKCTSKIKMNASQSEDSHPGYCIPM